MTFVNAPAASRGTRFTGTGFTGTRGEMFRLAFKTALFTLLTLGLYRFWAKTRLRRYYWSAVQPCGVPLEYAGQGVEKLLGFLIAVVFLAFYIGIVNLVLMFASFALFQGNVTAYALSFIGILPLYFFATYRARRYVLARTRWRGIRFGLEAGAWRYAARALMHWAITICTLGLLWPRMTFYLEKFRTDRTTFGSHRLCQTGRWQMLFPLWLNVILPVGIGAGLIWAMITRDLPASAAVLVVVMVLWMLWGMLHYKVQSKRLLANAKELRLQTGEAVGLIAKPRTGRVLGIYLGGYALIYMIFGAVFGVIGGMVFASGLTLDGWVTPQSGGIAQGLAVSLGAVLYFGVFLFWISLTQVFVTLPLWRHYAQTLEITGVRALGGIHQAARDEALEAGGFAEALDLGAAI